MFKSPFTLVCLLLVGCWAVSANAKDVSVVVQKIDKSELDEALKVCDHFLQHFNGQDWPARMKLLRYPYFRIHPDGSVTIQEAEDDMPERWKRDGTTFENFFDKLTTRTGWHHSTIDRTKVLQAVPLHVTLLEDYTRFDAAGKKIANGQILRVLTKTDDGWKIRLSSDVFYQSTKRKDVAEFSDEELNSALAANDILATAWNARDLRKFQEAYQFPHVQIDNKGRIHCPERADKVPQQWAKAGLTFENFFDRFSQATGWHRSDVESPQVLGKMRNSVHVLVRYTRYREDGGKLGSYQSVRVLQKADGRWGVRARATVKLEDFNSSGEQGAKPQDK